ncbi:MAG: hypothetical protein U0W24_12450 [Bacteroidales bacterium]
MAQNYLHGRASPKINANVSSYWLEFEKENGEVKAGTSPAIFFFLFK